MTEQKTTAVSQKQKMYSYFVTGIVINGPQIGYRTMIVSKASPIRDEIDVRNLRDFMRKEKGTPTLDIMAFSRFED